MAYIGDFAEDYATLNTKFTTVGSDGASTVLAGSPVISVYKANGTTQSTAGITLSVDFDSVVGMNNVLIDLSSDAFYATGNDYQVVVTTGTVGGVSIVGYVVAEFSIENRFVRGTDSALLASSAPTNFGALGIESDGDITKVNLVAVTTLTDTTTDVTNEVTSDMTKINGVAASAANLEQGAFALVRGSAITGTLTTTTFTTDLTEATDDHYNGRVVTFTSGALDGQSTDITDYTGSTKLITVTAMTEAPSNTDTFVIS